MEENNIASPGFKFQLGDLLRLKSGSQVMQIVGRGRIEYVTHIEEVYHLSAWVEGRGSCLQVISEDMLELNPRWAMNTAPASAVSQKD